MLEKTISRSIPRQLFSQEVVGFTMFLNSCAELFFIFLDQRSTFFFSSVNFCLGENDVLRIKGCIISGGISDMQNPGSDCSRVKNRVLYSKLWFLKGPKKILSSSVEMSHYL